MSATTELTRALETVLPARVYPLTFPQPAGASRPAAAWPACRYQQVGAATYVDQCGQDAGETDDVSFQIDVAASGFDEVRALVVQIRLALAGTTPPCVVDDVSFGYEPTTKTNRASLDVTFYPSSSTDSPA